MARRILVAVDNPIQAEHVRLLLEGAGYLVHMAANGREGLQSAQSAPPDLIISDVGLPEVDGYAFCRAVKSDEATKRIPFVLLTKRKSPIDIVHGLEIGADNFITKPFDDEYLLERVRRIFEHLEFRHKGYLEVEVTVHVAGRDISITADKQQIIELLFASFEELERVNARLVESQRIVERHAEELEAEVDRRTGQLRESEARFRSAFGDAAIGMALVATDCRILQVNRSLTEIVGYSEQELMATTFQAITHPDDLEPSLAYARQALAGDRRSFQMEKRHIHKQGHEVWVLLSTSLVRDDNGTPLYFVSQVQDITSRKRAEEALQVSEERAKRLVELCPIGIMVGDTSGNILEVNDAFVRMLGHTREEVLSRKVNWKELTPPELRHLDVRAIEEVRRTGTHVPFEKEYVHKGGTRVPVLVGTAYLGGPDELGIGFLVDITERVRAEEALRESETRFRSAFGDAAIGMALVATDGRFLQVNRSLCEMVGYSEQELMALTFQAITHPDDLQPSLALLRQALAGERLSYQMEKRYFHRLGQVVWALLTVSLVRNAGGNPQYFVSQIQDITERKLAEATHQALSQRLVEVQEGERRSIARELHDEIGQVLTGLKLTLEMAGRLSAEAFKTSLDEAQVLVDDLMTRVRELSLDLRPAMLDDLGLLPALLWHFERYGTRTNARVSFKQSGLEGGRFSSKLETAIYRIVQEALTNVARHAAVCEVVVQVWVRQDAIVVQIEDHGVGFDPKTVLSAGESSGLAGMRERAVLMGGYLTIDSAPGAGTRITAELPLGDPIERRLKER